jgi:hypothetical protein
VLRARGLCRLAVRAGDAMSAALVIDASSSDAPLSLAAVLAVNGAVGTQAAAGSGSAGATSAATGVPAAQRLTSVRRLQIARGVARALVRA